MSISISVCSNTHTHTHTHTQIYSAKMSETIMASSTSFRPTWFQNRAVLRAGWLKYIPFAEQASSGEHKFWVVFALYDQSIPYLEFYQKRQTPPIPGTSSTTSRFDGPVSKHSLLNCRHVCAVIVGSRDHFEFSIILETYVIRLAADTDEVMYDWIGMLKTKLTALRILENVENEYSGCPVSANQIENTRINQNNNVDNIILASNNDNDNVDDENGDDDNELYEPIFAINGTSDRLMESQFSQLSVGENPAAVPHGEGPPPYGVSNLNSSTPSPPRTSALSFREAQVQKLKQEMETHEGINLQVRKKDCYNAVAFVDITPYGIFIAGWRQKDHPHLHSTFHIGDQLTHVNSVPMECAAQARHFIKHCTRHVDLTVRRIPFGQVFCLKRSYDGEDLGLTRDRGTAEIVHVAPSGIAARAGLTASCDYHRDQDPGPDYQDANYDRNWCLTEINNRPLNLFFKRDEIADRLNAIGKEISLIVQPNSFVCSLRKQLKSGGKSYKQFIVQ